MKIFLTSIALLFSSLLLAQHWNISTLQPLPEKVSNNAVCEGFIDGEPYVFSFGGIDSTKSAAGIHLRSFRYAVNEQEWEIIPELPDTLGKIAASANRIGDTIFIIGGYHVFPDGSELSSDRVHRYHVPSNTFLSDGAPIPVPIDDQVQVVYQNRLIYVVSGWSNVANVNDVQIYDPVLDAWTAGSPITWMEQPVFGAAGAIVGDTIYFYGGAKNGDFSVSNVIRKGAINPQDPTLIEWSSEFLSSSIKAYRPAATTVDQSVYFIGGSDETYNYDGLAYSTGEGVVPNYQSFLYRPEDGFFEAMQNTALPMDLRGIANISDSIKFLAGGMLENQEVTNQLTRLAWIEEITATTLPHTAAQRVSIFPNPVQNRLTVVFEEDINASEVNLRLRSVLGNIVLQTPVNSVTEMLEFSSLDPGIYFLEVQHQSQITSYKVVKIDF